MRRVFFLLFSFGLDGLFCLGVHRGMRVQLELALGYEGTGEKRQSGFDVISRNVRVWSAVQWQKSKNVTIMLLNAYFH